MRLWIDADACPRAAKELIYSAAEAYRLETILVANSFMRTPKSDYIRFQEVEKGFDVADKYIAEQVEKGDVVVTADIPLAAQIVDAGAVGVDPRGEVFTENNVYSKLATRNLLADLREFGEINSGGPPPYKQKDRNKFGATLDRLLTSLLTNGKLPPDLSGEIYY